MRVFEIRVAIVGYVSVGKSTVLNALLGDKYSEVSMRRTTAGINFFYLEDAMAVVSATDEYIEQEEVILDAKNLFLDEDGSHSGKSSLNGDSSEKENSGDSASEAAAKATHEEICKDNAALRGKDDIQEKSFNIAMEEPICQEMREDTRLVLIDIPGVNEADSRSKYKEYVTSQWNTFDCVIVVMDAVQGVNTEEQVELLRFVKSNNQKYKDIPTIILGNKVDDPDDAEKQSIVDESREKVVEIFGENCSDDGLKTIIEAVKYGNTSAIEDTAKATFIPISAMNAFLYRMASKLTLENFEKLDQDVVDKIGHEEVGRKWKRMSQLQKFATIQAAVSDPSEYQERLSGTNFNNFLSVLTFFVCGEAVQSRLLGKQLEVKLSLLNSSVDSITGEIQSVHDAAEKIGILVPNLPGHFWRLYDDCEEKAFRDLQSSVDPSSLAALLSELLDYHQVATQMNWKDELKTNINPRMKGLVHRQIRFLFEQEKQWDFANWYNRVHISGWPYWKQPGVQWKNLSPFDWVTIASSILLFSFDSRFREEFGTEVFALEQLRLHHNEYHSTITFDFLSCGETYSSSTRKNACYARFNYRDAFQDEGEEAMQALKLVSMPSSVFNSTHWGHVVWKYCKFLALME